MSEEVLPGLSKFPHVPPRVDASNSLASIVNNHALHKSQLYKVLMLVTPLIYSIFVKSMRYTIILSLNFMILMLLKVD